MASGSRRNHFRCEQTWKCGGKLHKDRRTYHAHRRLAVQQGMLDEWWERSQGSDERGGNSDEEQHEGCWWPATFEDRNLNLSEARRSTTTDQGNLNLTGEGNLNLTDEGNLNLTDEHDASLSDEDSFDLA